MSERGFRLGSWQAFVVVAVFVVAGIAFIIRSAPEHDGGSARRAAPPAAAPVSDDSLEEAAEREVIRESMSLAVVANRGGIPVESLITELRLPSTVSRTDSLRFVMREHHITLQNVVEARRRVRQRQ